jgi:hypothetical protein
MIRKSFFHRLGRKRRFLLTGLAVVLPVLLIFFATVRIDIKGHFDGLFLLKGTHGWRYELQDDLYVGDGDRIIYSIDFDDPRFRISRSLHRRNPGTPYLYYEWDANDGSGFVRNFLRDGTQLLTCFGRFRDDDRQRVHGLFVGGGLPESIIPGDNVYMNNTGMAYYDTNRWYHVWCNVNEGFISPLDNRPYTPSSWRFLGSKVLDESDQTLVIASSHELILDGNPLRIDRYVYLDAGDTYFTLTLKITNTGIKPARYVYVYGDEPWVGNYGTSAGNVGWVKDRLIKYEEVLDTTKYSWAGIFDYGNDAIGEEHNYTLTANFLEWLGEEKPTVYFSNDTEIHERAGRKVPLASDARFIGLQWGPRVILPGESVYYHLAVGMAGHDPKTGFPVKPEIKIRQLQ